MNRAWIYKNAKITVAGSMHSESHSTNLDLLNEKEQSQYRENLKKILEN